MPGRIDLTLDISNDDVVSGDGVAGATDPSDDPMENHQGDFQLALESVRNEADLLAFSVDSPSQYRQRRIQIHVVDRRFKYPTWMHPNIGGEAQHLSGPDGSFLANEKRKAAEKHQLSEWMATAISGNDILSSVLFTAGLSTAAAGKLAPVANLIVVLVVFGLRSVLSEVMSAVPLNGGCYSAVLNSASKLTASIPAIFSMLSYLATGVVCGVAALQYLNTIIEVPVVLATIAMLLAFALLCLMGIAESAFVALGFFGAHILTLSVLLVTSLVYMIQNPSIFGANMETPFPDVSVWGQAVTGNVFTALFFGYGTSMLGMTGFEASAQFVEEQAPGVFPKTLRNMWALSSLFNVAFAVLALGVLPMDGPEGIIAKKEVVLAEMGRVTAGRWLQWWVSIDAVVVLAGAVLTSYVGITGLVQRLAMDRVLPRTLTRTNSFRGTAHYVILIYFVAASSLVIAMNGRIQSLAGVFAFAFLGVLGSFCVGCLLLKLYRDEMPRTCRASWLNCAGCLMMIVLCFVANALADPHTLSYFALYFAAIGVVVFTMLKRVSILTATLEMTRRFLKWWRSRSESDSPASHPPPIARPSGLAARAEFVGSVSIAKSIEKIKRTPTIFFCKGPQLPKINEAIAYVLANEQTYCLRLVHVLASDQDAVPREFEDLVCLFDHIYPWLKIDFVSVRGEFSPEMVAWCAEQLGVPPNMMFMRQPTTGAMHAVARVGVRVIAG
ncbi:hypothetical protein ATCC90586_005832 [Pythium insidiosum]|nr:hypothetical protein ATCC90586_005832 [Pythium insidiosum]